MEIKKNPLKYVNFKFESYLLKKSDNINITNYGSNENLYIPLYHLLKKLTSFVDVKWNPF